MTIRGSTGDLSNNFEVDNVNPANGFTLGRPPITFPVLSNFTAIGPNNASGTKATYGYGMRWRRGAKFILANSIVIGGQQAGLVVEDDSTAIYYKKGESKFYNSLLSSVALPFFSKGRPGEGDLDRCCPGDHDHNYQWQCTANNCRGCQAGRSFQQCQPESEAAGRFTGADESREIRSGQAECSFL